MKRCLRVLALTLLAASCQGCYYMYAALNSYDRKAPFVKVEGLERNTEYVSVKPLYLNPQSRQVGETPHRDLVEIPRGARIAVREVRFRSAMHHVVEVSKFHYLVCDIETESSRYESVDVPALVDDMEGRGMRINSRIARPAPH